MQSTPPAQTPAPGHQHPDPANNDARYTAILDDLITMAATLARRVHETAMAETTPAATAAESTVAFDRISRCVRRCIAQARHIAANPAGSAAHAPHARAQARARVIRQVEDAIATHARVERPGAEHTESLRAELTERLDDPDLDLDLETRPIADIIADIIQDLGVASQGRSWIFQRRTPAEATALRQRAAAPPGITPPGTIPPGTTPSRRPDS